MKLKFALYNKVKLTIPTISALLKIQSPQIKFAEQLRYGIALGLLSGILIIFVSFIYGGFTEELLLRFGFMTFVIWCISKIIGRLNTSIYWIALDTFLLFLMLLLILVSFY